MNTEQLIEKAKELIADNKTPESIGKQLYKEHKSTVRELAIVLKEAIEYKPQPKSSKRKRKTQMSVAKMENQQDDQMVEDATYLASLLVASIPGVTPLDVADALKDPRNYPSLTAYQLGSVLMDDSVFPTITSDEMQTTLTDTTCGNTPCYTTQEVTDAINQLYPVDEPTDDPIYTRTPVSGRNGQMPFDDTTLANGRRITKLVIHHGNVIDGFKVYYDNPSQASDQHGGNGGNVTEVTIPENDVLVEVSGYWGSWFGASYILQMTLKTRNGNTYGPFGDMAFARSQTAYKISTSGDNTQQIVAFFGSATYGDNGRLTLLGSIGAVIREN